MTAPEFGTLETVDLRMAWAHEAHGFTPWLADNLDRLSEALGVPLELEGREMAVGSFSADLLARNPADGSLVLIENQLETTDHRHLGQILTYLVGLKAQCVVWIAASFREPHLSAIHWLNENTQAPFVFFGVQLKAVRIGDSAIAPLFEVVARPNGWDRQIQQQLRTSEELSDLGRWRMSFWDCLLQRHPEQSEWGSSQATSSRWRPVPGTDLVVAIYLAQQSVGLFVRGQRGTDRLNVLDQLAPERQHLEACLGCPCGDGVSSSYFFSQTKHGDLRDEASWPLMMDWLHQTQTMYVDVLYKQLGNE